MIIQAKKHLPWLGITCFLLTGAHAPLASSHESDMTVSCEAVSSHHDLGQHGFAITTRSQEAQKFFNEGINWAYGFHHAEAEASFRAAAAADPACAMCQWGVAYVLGPNINAPMFPAAVPAAYEAIQKAISLMSQATDREKAYINAMAERYSPKVLADRSTLDRAYAEAMMQVAKRFPNDLEASVLAVEAMMDTMPWNYWEADGKPRKGTMEMISMLKQVLKSNAVHPGANHFLIHIVEKERPELAVKEADTLVDLVPDSGHLQHMASHIYIRVGRYHDAILANQRGIAADHKYLACPQNTVYEVIYIPHNYDFLIAAAYLEGSQELAMQTARELKKIVEPNVAANLSTPDFQNFWSTPYMTHVRFGEWRDMMREPAPPKDWKYARALWHFGRALAAAKTERFDLASREIGYMEILAKRREFKDALLAGLNPAANVLAIGIEEAKGELAAAQGQMERAIRHFEKAVELQDALTYIEPPAWYRSMRLPLGQVLLAAGRAAEAQKVFDKDLRLFPANGWALYGKYQSLVAQERMDEANKVMDQFEKAWRYSDFNVQSMMSKLD